MSERMIMMELTRIEVAGIAIDALNYIIPDDVPAAAREGLARQNLTIVGEACPCGAQVKLDRAARRRLARGRPLVGDVWHALDCPGHPDRLAAELAEWRRAA